ncbi:LEA type 2 family protein [Thalassotalea sp. PS06]|uniref:LEA type 2 family protein n=1 Tax=Thalassotalea sp. PS06 TaxID=2594005 RepID=UPI0011636329|nr:LEA type 2 family protein [Thalassotalea sp. PS06]QDO99940.1 LEA type 2 family protein [Thalassotalea sp. PS06]
MLKNSLVRCTALISLCAVLLSGCAGLGFNVEEPEIDVVGVRMLPVKGLSPKFEITLEVFNPNDFELNFSKVSYEFVVNGASLFTGNRYQVPPLEPFSTQTITLKGKASLLNSLKVLKQFADQPNKAVDYEFNARLEFANLLPDIPINKTGTFDPSEW